MAHTVEGAKRWRPRWAKVGEIGDVRGVVHGAGLERDTWRRGSNVLNRSLKVLGGARFRTAIPSKVLGVRAAVSF
jgi:hypothetical protein